MSSRLPADAAEREAALDVRRSFIVQAPAGSGKTELLVQRYLRLLDIVEKPEEIVAITFTRKAAAQMRNRVMEKLPPALAPRLRIQTIDALCASLTRQMPVLARFGAQPAVTEDATKLYREAAVRTLAELTPPVARLLAHLDNNVAIAADLLADMLERRDQWLRRTGEAPGREELEAVLASERERLLRRAVALHPLASHDLAGTVLTARGEWRKRPPVAPAEMMQVEGMLEALVDLRAAPPPAYTQTQWEALEAILALLKPAVAQLLALFGERGEVDFTQIAHGALQALGTPEEPTDLLLSMDARVRHLLVDEFQDTSNSQWELLERLTAGWEAGDGRTIFVVGDPMQSIYRFRDAQVGLFLQARREGLPGVRLEPLRLSTNFRSQAGVVEWVNRLFPAVLPAAEDEASGAVPYSASVPFHSPSDDGEPALETFPDRGQEARRVVELARSAVGRTAILVRNRTHLDAVVPALKAAGIRFRAVEIEQLGERQVVQDLFALTRALTHAADRVAWLAVLRAPWCGLTLEELTGFFEARRQETIWELMQPHPRLERIRAVLRPAIEDRMRGTLRDRVEGAWLALGGPACVQEPTDLEDAEIFFDELERLEQGGELERFSSLADSLARLFALPDVNAGDDAVEIMTIHKAKGLEFDTVIVPGLDRRPRGGNRPLFAWRGLPGNRLLLAPIDETGGEPEALYEYVRSLDVEAEDIEAGRLFYVAATRAKRRLHLLACVKRDEAGAIVPPSRRCLLGLAWRALPAQAPPAPTAGDTVGRAAPANVLRRLPSGFRLPAPPPAVEWVHADALREAGGDIEFSWVGESARHVGSVVHRWLQRIADDEMRGWSRVRVEGLRRVFRDALAMRGIPEAELDAAATRVVDALANTLEDERGRWLLGPQAQARNEFRLTAVLAGERRNLVIDRTFVDAQGRRRIVDYKTSGHEGTEVDVFLDREQERYRAQLERYAAALGAESSDLGLYFPLLSAWREWKSGG
ncbi:MAG TPA: UvrD-helicase domain-containing protein [Burkholderiales bacterium]|jgi:ATP-dependent exoDNAse (exonuclease V) beta subunit|nr:UvrD-helicase domain-containing protein [Burkholderiales bacterium]